MKIFISYRFTGEDINELRTILARISDALELRSNEVFCSLFLEDFFRNNGFSADDIYAYCLEQLEAHEIVVFFIKSPNASKGMELELEHAISSRKKIVLAIQKQLIFNEFRQAAHSVIEYDELSDLFCILKEMNL